MGHRKTLSPRQDRTRGIPALYPTAQRRDSWKARLYTPASCVTRFLRTSRISTVEHKFPVWWQTIRELTPPRGLWSPTKASDWWRNASHHGKEKEERRRTWQILCQLSRPFTPSRHPLRGNARETNVELGGCKRVVPGPMWSYSQNLDNLPQEK